MRTKRLWHGLRAMPLAAAVLLSIAGCPMPDEDTDGSDASGGATRTANATAPGTDGNGGAAPSSTTSSPPADPNAPAPMPAPTLKVDATVKPLTATIDGIDGGAPRPLAAMTDSSGQPCEFVENELLLTTNDDARVNAFVARWDGQVLGVQDPAQYGLPGEKMFLVRINPALANLSRAEADLAAINPQRTGELRVGSDAAAALVAAAAEEMATGNNIGINFVLRSESFADRNVTEGAGMPNTPMIGGAAYTPNPFAWSYMSLAGGQNTGVAEAWALLDRAGKLGNKINVAVIDGGFSQGQDMPTSWVHHTNSIHAMDPFRMNELTCTGGGACPWHGMEAVMTLAGRADNSFGAAGSAGPVVGRVTTIRLSGDVFNYVGAFLIGYGSGSRIISMSVSARVPALATPALAPMNFITSAGRAAGVLFFASAGNDNSDVDAEDCFDPCPIIDCEICWERAWITPCENDGVIGVGSLAPNSKYRRGDSNYGAEEVDIFGPGLVWVGPTPQNQFIHTFSATSAACPFVAGCAALIWAANPALSANDVERILMQTAHPSPDSSVSRTVNAWGAVYQVLGNAPPELRITSPDPSDPAWRGFGGRGFTFACEASDLEDGVPRVVWTSDRIGVIGEGIAFSRDLPFGRHVVTATATDSRGATTVRSIAFEYANAPPRIEIERPLDGMSTYAGQRFLLRAWSFDPEAFGELPNDNLVWSTPTRAFLGRGKQVEVEFNNVGVQVITLTGTDVDGRSTSVSVTVTMTTPPANYPPAAEIVAVDIPVNATGRLANNADYRDCLLTAYAWDRENGYLRDDAVAWRLDSNQLTWDIQLGEIERGTIVRRRIYGYGTGRVTLTVTDRDGNSTTATRDITIAVPPR
ncbi:MAG: S8 family serine peptidase [Phycisphaerae bacterium]